MDPNKLDTILATLDGLRSAVEGFRSEASSADAKAKADKEKADKDKADKERSDAEAKEKADKEKGERSDMDGERKAAVAELRELIGTRSADKFEKAEKIGAPVEVLRTLAYEAITSAPGTKTLTPPANHEAQRSEQSYAADMSGLWGEFGSGQRKDDVGARIDSLVEALKGLKA